METKLYNKEGKEVGKVQVPESIFGLAWNADLVHQVVTTIQGNARAGTAHTKDRGEVRGGGKKPWKQKGTGRARHGSSRSPIWRGGGVTHGPRSDKEYARKVNQKMRQKALLVALSRKFHDGEVLFVDSLELNAPKTAEAKKMVTALSKNFTALAKKKNAALFTIPSKHEATQKSFQNFGNVTMDEVRNLNPLAVLSSKYLVIVDPKQSFEVLGKKQVIKTN